MDSFWQMSSLLHKTRNHSLVILGTLVKTSRKTFVNKIQLKIIKSIKLSDYTRVAQGRVYRPNSLSVFGSVKPLNFQYADKFFRFFSKFRSFPAHFMGFSKFCRFYRDILIDYALTWHADKIPLSYTT